MKKSMHDQTADTPASYRSSNEIAPGNPHIATTEHEVLAASACLNTYGHGQDKTALAGFYGESDDVLTYVEIEPCYAIRAEDLNGQNASRLAHQIISELFILKGLPSAFDLHRGVQAEIDQRKFNLAYLQLKLAIEEMPKHSVLRFQQQGDHFSLRYVAEPQFTSSHVRLSGPFYRYGKPANSGLRIGLTPDGRHLTNTDDEIISDQDAVSLCQRTAIMAGDDIYHYLGDPLAYQAVLLIRETVSQQRLSNDMAMPLWRHVEALRDCVDGTSSIGTSTDISNFDEMIEDYADAAKLDPDDGITALSFLHNNAHEIAASTSTSPAAQKLCRTIEATLALFAPVQIHDFDEIEEYSEALKLICDQNKDSHLPQNFSADLAETSIEIDAEDERLGSMYESVIAYLHGMPSQHKAVNADGIRYGLYADQEHRYMSIETDDHLTLCCWTDRAMPFEGITQH